MRKLFWQISVTLDGFMEGPNRELDDTAQVRDRNFDRYASEMLQALGGIILGRKTYQLFAGYWPTATGPDADRLNQLPKFVFSRTLERVDWNNSRLLRDGVANAVARLKRQPGGDLAVFGSVSLASTLIQLGLIDGLRFLVTPIILGCGMPVFRDLTSRTGLRLLSAETWSSGTVALRYLPAPCERDGATLRSA